MPEGNISFLITRTEKKLLDDLLLLDPEFEGIIDSAKKEEGQFRLEMSVEDLDEGLNSLAACANHADSKKEQKKLDALYDKLRGYLTLSRSMKRKRCCRCGISPEFMIIHKITCAI